MAQTTIILYKWTSFGLLSIKQFFANTVFYIFKACRNRRNRDGINKKYFIWSYYNLIKISCLSSYSLVARSCICRGLQHGPSTTLSGCVSRGTGGHWSLITSRSTGSGNSATLVTLFWRHSPSSTSSLRFMRTASRLD